MRHLLTSFAVVLCAAPVPAVEPGTRARAACVSVWTGAPGTTGARFGGSGVVIAASDDRSLVVTNNHIFSEQPHPDGGFRDDVYPQPATVRSGGTEYRATALAADRTADVAVVLVEGQLSPAAVADEVPAVGSKVWRNGIGSGYQTGTITTPENALARFSITVRGRSESGDSGAGYFNENDELVGIHCGQDGAGRPRGTAVRFVNVVVSDRAPLPLFPRLRDRLAARFGAVAPPASGPAPGPAPGPVPQPVPQPQVDPQPQPAPVPVPAIIYQQVTYVGRFGRTYTVWELVPVPVPVPNAPAPAVSPTCPNGTCPAPTTRRGLFR